MPDDLRRQLPDEVVDELLAGARTEEEIVGLIPPDDGWRAQTRQPDVLPWFPMVSHRGGFPNGS